MSKIERFEDLEIWKQAKDLCKEVYILTNKESFSKDFSLKDQIKLQKDLKEMEIKNLSHFCIIQKDHVEKLDPNYIEP
jgi:hypothetical protein